MPNYVTSSPWQDAANFGSSIGDRLAAALIDLPLKRQAVAQQLLEQKAALGQQAFQNRLATERLSEDRLHRTAEEHHWNSQDELKKEAGFAGRLRGIGTQELDRQKLEETQLHDRATEQNAGDRIAEQHRQAGVKAIETMRHPEFGGRTVAEMVKLQDNDTAWANVPQEQKETFQKYLDSLKVGAAKEKGASPDMRREIPKQSTNQGVGGALPSKKYKYDPATGIMIPQ